MLLSSLVFSLVSGVVMASSSQEARKSYDHLVPIPLTTASRQQQRKLEATPTQEEGHPQQVDSLYQGYGEHYVDLWCGTPPQRQTLIINTGGHGTAFPCSRCQNDCGLNYHTDRYFNESNSLTFHQLSCGECQLGRCNNADDPSKQGSCRFGLAYAEGSSWFATEAVDRCYIGGLHDKPISIDDAGTSDLDPEHAVAFGFDLNFGCQTSISGLFRTQLADGILAMDNSPNSFWQQMYAAHKMQDELFSLCYAKQVHADKSGSEAGAMTLGGSDDRLHLHPMVFSKHEDVWGLNYGVLLRKIHLREGGGGDSMNATKSNLKVVTVDVEADVLNEGGVIIESGTTNTYMTEQMAEPFKEAWKQLVEIEYDNNSPLEWTQEQIQALPTIVLQFEGAEDLNKQVSPTQNVFNLAGDAYDPDHPWDVVVAMPPNHYMQYNSLTRTYTPRFYMGENPSGVSTLGANAIMGHDVLFDAKNHRIGWAESHCDYSHLINDAGFDKKGKEHPKRKKDDPAPSPSYPASSSSSTDSFCSSDSCRRGAIFLIAASVLGIMLVARKGGARLVGGRGYSLASEELGNDSELELRTSYESPTNSYEIS